MPAYVPEYLKSKNRQTVFNMFVKNMTLSRAQIVQETEMSFPTVSKAVDFLISRDIVRESKETSLPAKGPGRRRNQLVFNPAAFYALTLAFEGSSVEIGIADLAGGILRFETRPFANFTAKEKYDELADYLQAVLAELSSPLLGIGIALPVDVDSDTGRIISAFNISGNDCQCVEENFRYLADKLGLACFIGNDVNLACRGENFARHCGENKENLCFLTLGSGFGAGILLYGQLWTGAGAHSGEIGHILMQPIDLNAPLEPQITMLEDTINLQAIHQKFGVMLSAEPPADPAQKRAIIRYLLPNLATAMFNFEMTFDIGNYVLSGLIPHALGEDLRIQLEELVNHMLISKDRSIRLTSPQAEHPTLIGAANLVFEKTLLNELTV